MNFCQLISVYEATPRSCGYLSGKVRLFVRAGVARLSVYTDIKKLFDEYEIKTIPVDEKGLDYLEKIFYSLRTYSKYVNPILRNEDKIWGYLELVSHIEIKTELAVKILENLCDRELWEINFNSRIIEKFVVSLYNQNQYSNKVLCQNIAKLINIIIDYYLSTQDHCLDDNPRLNSCYRAGQSLLYKAVGYCHYL